MVTVKPSGSLAGVGRTSRARFSCILFFLFVTTLYYYISIDFDNAIWLSKETNAAAAESSTTMVEIDSDELDASHNYIRSVNNFSRALKFLHIPKNAGSAIEEVAGGKQPQFWGGCLFKHKPKRKSCIYPKGGWWPKHVAWWHIPRQFFPLGNVDPYREADIFGVLREPLDRILSEFYYVCSLRHEEWRPYQCDKLRLFEPDYLNDWLQRKIQALPENPSAERYLMDFGHFTPQYEFIFGPNEVRMVDYVLFMDDSFGRSFDQLMAAFALQDIKIKKFNAIGAKERKVDTHLNVTHLDQQTLSVFNSRYSQDFALFGTTLEIPSQTSDEGKDNNTTT